MKGFLYTFGFIALLAIIAAFVFDHAEAPTQAVDDTETVTNVSGTFGMKLYETKSIPGATVNVWAVTEDSRCPSGVQCIWAGRVKVAANLGTAAGTSSAELEPGQSLISGDSKITLQEVLPVQKQGHKIADDEYEFVFTLTAASSSYDRSPVPVPDPSPEPKPVPPQSNGCYVGGCSSQLCTDKQGAISTCEYRPEYKCYQSATCERQANGQCGWTETPELSKCIRDAKTI